jgi:hypothetical protein|tara:strand:+ start:110 stop:331 length:222 start_codon:yes stop_codon:yes gene_type:complete
MLVLENEYKYFIKYLITFIDDIGNLIIELNKNSLSSEQFIKKLSLIVLDPKYRIQLGMLIILISFIIYIVSVL